MVLDGIRRTYGAAKLRIRSVGFPNAYNAVSPDDSPMGASYICPSTLLETYPTRQRFWSIHPAAAGPHGNRAIVATLQRLLAMEVLLLLTGSFAGDTF